MGLPPKPTFLAKFPGAPVPSAGRLPRPSEFRAVVPRFSFPVSSGAGNPAVPQLNERRLSPLFCGRRSVRCDLRDLPALKHDGPTRDYVALRSSGCGYPAKLEGHRTGGAAGDDNVWRPPARSGYAVYRERTGPTPDRFMKQFGRGGAGGGYAPSQPVRFNQPAQFKSGLQPPTAELAPVVI